MTDRNRTRALNAFAAMGHISADRVYTAEQMLYEAEAGICRLEKPQGRFRRFLNSGWGAAAVSGIVALAVLAFIVRAGLQTPAEPPPIPPIGSSIESGSMDVNYSLIMDYENYPEGTDRITVAMVGTTKGDTIFTPDGWYLERLTDREAEVVHIFYTEEFTEHTPKKDEYAVLKKTIRIERTPLTAGAYRLHATEHDGEKYVSVAWCEFTVGPVERPLPEDENSPYTLSVPNTVYGSVDITVTVTANEIGEGLPAINRGWQIVKLAGPENTGNTNIVHLEFGVEAGDPPAADTYATYTESLIPEDPSAWLPGIYRLYDVNGAGESVAHCDFVIYEEGHVPLSTEDPDCMVVPGIFLWADDIPMILLFDYYDGLYPEPAVTGGTVYPTLLNDQTEGGLQVRSGSVVEIVIGKKISYPNYGDLYGLRVVTEGTLNDVNPNWLIALRGAGYTITELPAFSPS